MEAKEIVVEEVERQAEFGYEPGWEDFVIAGKEAERREVVEWLIGDCPHVSHQRARHWCGECMEAKLKEWGL